MKMYVCHDCGHEFMRPRAVEESRGEFWGAPCWETMYYCPECGSEDFDYEETDKFIEEELDPELEEDKYFESLGAWKEDE